MAQIYRPGTYARPNIIIDDTAKVLSEEIEEVGDTFEKRKETLRLTKDAITEEVEKNRELVNIVQGIPETTMDDEARAVLMTELDELNDLMLKSVGKDQSEVIRKRKHVESLISNFGVGVGLMQNELDKYKEVMADNAVNGILTSTDPRYIEGLNAMLNKNGKGWNMSAVDGNWIMSYTNEKGEEVPINLQNFRNAVENTGFGLIKYTKDKSPEYVNIMKASPGYSQINALTQEIIEAEQKGLTKVVITKKKDLQQAIDNLRQDLTNNVTIQASIDENDWQNFAVDPNEVWAVNDPKKQTDQRIKTQQAVVEYLMNQAFPNDAQGKIVNEILASTEEKVGAPMSQAQAQSLKMQQERINMQKQKLLEKGELKERTIEDLSKNAEYANIINTIVKEQRDIANATDRFATMLNEVNANEGVNYVAGSNNDLINQLAIEEEIDVNNKEAINALRERESGKIYKQKDGGKFFEIQFDINNPDEIFEILSKNTTGITEKDILKYNYKSSFLQSENKQSDPAGLGI